MYLKIIKKYFGSEVDLFLKAIKKYYGNNGRAKRLEYWIVTTICIMLYGFDYFVNNVIITPGYHNIKEIPWYETVGIILAALLVLIYWFLYVSTAFRRCTDIGISRWCALLVAVPYVNYAVIILLGLLKTDAARTPAAQAKIKKVMSLFKSK